MGGAFGKGKVLQSKQQQQSAKKKPNPFDMKVSKPKFDVLGRDGRGIKGAPSRSKQRSEAVRTATLLPELKQRGRASAFVDRRFGERDQNLSLEEKMLERFSRVKQQQAKELNVRKGKKRSVFNLDMEDEYGDDSLAGLTHLGQDVDDLEEFSDPEEGRFDHDPGLIDGRSVKKVHFGGFGEEGEASEGEEEQPVVKTKAEIMREVIAKSKFYKAERQKIKEENEEICAELDDSFKDAVKSGLLGEKLDRSKESYGATASAAEDEYDSIFKTMIFDKRSKPTDRTLTEEEQALKREAAIEAREARMHGKPKAEEEDDTDDEDGGKADTRSESKGVDKEEERATEALDVFCDAPDLETLNAAYKKLCQMSSGPASVALGRAIRTKFAALNRKLSKGRPFMPAKSALLLFHLVGRIYSTSDFHHVIVTPASLLMGAFLEHGRMTRPKHLASALFLAQTILQYQQHSHRIYPELFNVIQLIINLFDGKSSKNSFAFDAMYNRLLAERLQAVYNIEPSCTPSKLTFEDLLNVPKEFTEEFGGKLFSALLQVIVTAGNIYSGSPAFPDLFSPIIDALPNFDGLATLKVIVQSASSRRKPLLLQHHKPVALPMLTPDLGTPQDKDSRDQARLKAAFKREYKGAKREIRRDAQFLTRHETSERKRKDQEYKQMINRVYGTIANDAAGSSKRPKRSNN